MDKVYNMRHFKKFKVFYREARITSHFPIEGDKSFEAKEWSVMIGLSRHSENYVNCIGPFTLNDLKRLRRVIDRAIKIVENPKKHNNKLKW